MFYQMYFYRIVFMYIEFIYCQCVSRWQLVVQRTGMNWSPFSLQHDLVGDTSLFIAIVLFLIDARLSRANSSSPGGVGAAFCLLWQQ